MVDRDSEDKTAELLQFYSYLLIQIFQSFSLLFMLLIVVFFIYNFFKKTSAVCTVYFYLLVVGLFWGIISLTWKELSWITHYRRPWIEITNGIFQWYTAQLSAIWTLALVVNRFTAILWWQKHNQFWKQHLWKIILLILVYPFLVNGYSFFNLQCRFMQKSCKDANYWIEDADVTGISSVAVAALALTLSIVTTVKYSTKMGRKHNDSTNQKTEQKLLFHTLITSIIYIASSILRVYGQFARRKSYGYYEALGYWAVQFSMTLPYVVYQLSAFILIFVFS